MSLLDKYKTYRKKQVELHTRILEEFVSDEELIKSSGILGILKHNEAVLESEAELDSIYDFNMYEHSEANRSAVSKYVEKYGFDNEEEEELLRAMTQAETLLCEVVELDQENSIIVLKELSDRDRKIRLYDINLSQTILPGVLMFSRIIHLKEFSITSGVSYVFNKDHRDYILNRSRKMIKKVGSGDPSADRFIAFFHLNRSDGTNRMLKQVE